MAISNLSPQQLRKAADLKEKIDALQQQYNELLGGVASAAATPEPAQAPKAGRRRRKLSPQAIANIRAGVAKRMAKQGRSPKAGNSEPAARKPKRKMSAAARARLSALAKARWKEARAAGKSNL